MGGKLVVLVILVYLIISVAELCLVYWLGKREQIFSFHSRQYFMLLITGNLLLMIFSIYREHSGGNMAVWYFGLWTYLFCLGIYDLKCRELPDWWHLLPVIIYATAWIFGFQPVIIRSSLFITVMMAAMLGLVYLIRKDAIGLGDIKLILVCAFYLGQDCIGMLIRGMTAAFVCSIILLLCKKVTPKSGLPFVPFLLLGALFI